MNGIEGEVLVERVLIRVVIVRASVVLPVINELVLLERMVGENGGMIPEPGIPEMAMSNL